MGQDNPSASKLPVETATASALGEATAAEAAAEAAREHPVDPSALVPDNRRSLAEWITLSICTVVLALLVGLVLYDWQISRNLPPAFQIEISPATRFTGGHYYVPFTLRNTGGRIARTVQVIAELQTDDGDNESGEQQFDFLSGSERKKGGFVFEHNPQQGELIVRVASFGLP